MRTIVIALLVCACSKSKGGVDCEALRDKYVAWAEQNMKDAVGGIESGSDREAIIAQGQKELEQAKVRFVGACTELRDTIDPECFDKPSTRDTDKAHKKHCRDVNKELDHKIYATP
jgi:hypothetical protein